ncbi:hypothetical protein GCM10010390_00210 [Streptomyces mordarskii]
MSVRAGPGRVRGLLKVAYGGWETGAMPVLDENPPDGQKKLLIILGVMLGITVVVGVIATLASP